MKDHCYKELMDVPYEDLPIRLLKKQVEPITCCIIPHWHERIEFLYVLEGSFSLICGGQKYDIEKGDIAVINPCQLHCGITGKNGAVYYVLVCEPKLLDGNDICAVRFIQPLFSGNIYFKTKLHDEQLAHLIEDVVNEIESRGNAYQMVIKARFFEILALLYRGYIEQNRSIHNCDLAMKEILLYVDANFTLPLSAVKLATNFSFTESYFCRKFHRHTGMTLTQYILNRRLEMAGELLNSTTKSISEIAVECGFEDPNYFARCFKKRYGASPVCWRKEA